MSWATPYKLRTLAVAARVSASLSICGSSSIICSIVKRRKQMANQRNKKMTYNRLMLGMSCIDIVSSTWHFIGPWATPAHTQFSSDSAWGTQASCTAQGFFLQLGLVAPFYNLSLCFYYLVVISYNWKDAQVVRLEYFLHGITWTVTLAFAIAGLPLTLYNNLGPLCWIGGSPFGCEVDYNGWDCVRGANSDIYRVTFSVIPIWLWMIGGGISMYKVFRTVQRQEKDARKWRGHDKAKTKNIVTDAHALSSTLDEAQRRKKRRKERKKYNLTKEVAWQAIWYFLAVFIVWIPATVQNFSVMFLDRTKYWKALLAFITMPLQGFLNFFVYFRPRYLRYRRNHPEFSIRQSVWFLMKSCFPWRAMADDHDDDDGDDGGDDHDDDDKQPGCCDVVVPAPNDATDLTTVNDIKSQSLEETSNCEKLDGSIHREANYPDDERGSTFLNVMKASL